MDSRELIYGAIRGMLKTLDPHSNFMTPEEFKSMQEDTSGHFGGVGVEGAGRSRPARFSAIRRGSRHRP